MSGTNQIGTLTTFTPTQTSVFTFGATLDGVDYVCSVRWNLYAQRWYLVITDTSGNLVLTKALIASPPDYGINMVFGVFRASVMYFWDATQQFQVIP